MKKARVPFLILFAMCVTSVRGQIVGSSAFLQGTYLEIGIQGNGSFGANGSPAGYHPHSPSTSVGSPLAEVYDWGHDGWTVGTPPYMGDYTYPGSPFEGWEIQMNGARAQQYQSGGTTSSFYGGATMTSAGISYYDRSGGTARAMWNGNFGAGGATLAISQETRVDEYASWVTMNVKLRNTGSTMANNVYYMRSCEPNSDETWPGGGYSNYFEVTHQNDAVHRVLVSATGYSTTRPYMGLGTIDSRAMVMPYTAWGLGISYDLAPIWASSGSYPAGYHAGGDLGVLLIYNLGNIAPGDSAEFSYAYIFSDTLGLDSAVTLSGGVGSLLDSFAVIAHERCSGPDLTVYTHHYVAGASIETRYGDGTSDAHTLLPTPSGGTLVGRAAFSHIYPSSGTYTVKQILYNGSSAVDSITFSYVHVVCRDIRIRYFYDANGDSAKNGTEPYYFQPTLTEVDSNGVPVDTISATSGFCYQVRGVTGAVYGFRPLSVPAGMDVTSPGAGYITDTITGALDTAVKLFGMECDGSTNFDLRLFATFRAGVHTFGGQILLDNTYCTPPPGVLAVDVSPKYHYYSSSAAPASVLGTSVTWLETGLTSILTAPQVINMTLEKPGGSPAYLPGDTVNSIHIITPTSGDMNPGDNMMIRVDTVKTGYDPNYITVSPAGYIPAGTELTYAIAFENTGNDTAHNIYVMDTLSGYLDASSFRMLAATNYMEMTKIRSGSQRIMKFDFPHIMLPDSSHHNLCDGFLMYQIKTLVGLPAGTLVPARAGIYFDDNAVVVTNTATDIIGGSLANGGVMNDGEVLIYPNPASGEFVIRVDKGAFSSYVLTNSVGQVLIEDNLTGGRTRVDVKALPAGLYYVMLRGEGGSVVRKVVMEPRP